MVSQKGGRRDARGDPGDHLAPSAGWMGCGCVARSSGHLFAVPNSCRQLACPHPETRKSSPELPVQDMKGLTCTSQFVSERMARSRS
jgi:hypothetical protein